MKLIYGHPKPPSSSLFRDWDDQWDKEAWDHLEKYWGLRTLDDGIQLNPDGSIGWTITEEVGIVIINDYAVASIEVNTGDSSE